MLDRLHQRSSLDVRPWAWSRGIRLSLGLLALALSVAAAVPPPGRLPSCALALTLAAIYSGRRLLTLPGHVWAPVVGAGAVILLPRLLPALAWGPPLSGGAIRAELLDHVAVPALILALAYLASSLEQSGLFDWCSHRIIQLGRGSGGRLLICVFVAVSALTFVTSNDIVILSMTPILIHLGRNARIDNLTPFLITQFVAANTASMGLLIGNPTNIVIGEAVGLGFGAHAQRMWLPTLVSAAGALSLLLVIFVRVSRRNRVAARYRLPAHQPRWTREMTVKASLFASCLASIAIFGDGGVSDGPAGLLSSAHGTGLRSVVGIGLASGAMAFFIDLIADLGRGRQDLRPRLRRRLAGVPVDIVPFFFGFCLLLAALAESGMLRLPAESIVGAFERGGPVIGAAICGLYGVLAVNAINNIPATILFEKLWSARGQNLVGRLLPGQADVFVDCSIFASNFGANLSVVGALAGLIWFRIIDRAGAAPGWSCKLPTRREFVLYGLSVVLPVTAATCALIGWLR